MKKTQAFSVGIVIAVLSSQPPEISCQTLEVGATEFSFGLLDGPDDYVIGEIGDVAVAETGDIYFTDLRAMRVGWLHPDGSLGGWFGKEGDGPEEFSWLGAVAVLPDGRIVVADEGHRRVVFLRRGEAGLAFESALKINGYPGDLCVLHDHLYILSLQNGNVVHKLDRDGQVILSFGVPLGTPFELSDRWSGMVDRYSARGHLLCVEGSDRLVVLPDILPEVRAFDSSGRLQWERELSPYFRTTPTQTAQGSVTMNGDPRSGTTHLGVGIWERDGLLGIQLLEADLGGLPDAASEVRFLDLATGQELSRQNGVPRVASVAGSTIIAWENAPFPRIFKLRATVAR